MEINVYKNCQCANCVYCYDDEHCPVSDKPLIAWIPHFVDENNIELSCPCFVPFDI